MFGQIRGNFVPQVADSGQCWPKPSKTSTTGQCRSTLITFGPNLVDVDPKFVALGRNSADFGPNLFDHGAKLAASGTSCRNRLDIVDSAPKWSMLVQFVSNLSTLGPNTAVFGQDSARIRPNSSDVDRFRTGFGEFLADVPQIRAKSTGFAQIRPGCGACIETICGALTPESS